jgi:PTS system mannose-specific IIC component
MSLLQAFICGFLYYFTASPWLLGANFMVMSRPVVLGFIVGLVFGNPTQGLIVGATIQMLYLGYMSTGGSSPADPAIAGIVGTAIALQNNLSPEQAIAIAVPLGMLGLLFYQLRMMVIGLFWTHVADKAVEKGKTNLIKYTNVAGPEICMFIAYAIPLTIGLYLGSGAIEKAIGVLMGGPVLGIIGAIGGMLPALGIAMNMKAIFKGDARIFFFVGFFMVVYFNLNLIAVGCLSLLAALLYLVFTEKKEAA